MKWKLVIFDLDGTLVDTIEDLGTAVNFALESKGLPTHPIEAYKLMVGNGMRNLVYRAMPDDRKEDKALWDELLKIFLGYYYEHITVHSRPYAGMVELLEELCDAGVKVAVASNKIQRGTQDLMARLFPRVNFASVLGGRDGVPLKPDPSVVKEILAATGVAAEDAVLVGDSATDTATAANAGVLSIAVTWGFRPEDAASTSDFAVERVSDLRRLLLQ